MSAVAEVEFCQNIRSVAAGTLDVVFCLEVFEHIPLPARSKALSQIDQLIGTLRDVLEALD